MPEKAGDPDILPYFCWVFSFLPLVGVHLKILSLRENLGELDTALVFSIANNPISPCLPNWEVLTALLKLIVVLKKKFIQHLAQQYLNSFKWLEINELICYAI